MSPRARVNWLRVTLVVLVVVVVLAGVGAVGYVFYKQSPGSSSSTLSGQATEAPVTLGEIPLTTKVVKVAGALPAQQKKQAEQQIDELLTRYVSDAYLGIYPRSDFSSAFALMDPNLVKYATKDAGVIAGGQWASQSVSVDSGTLTANVSLLAFKKKPVGGTAKVTWTFQVSSLPPDLSGSATASEPSPTATTGSTAATTTVTVKGRILLALGSDGWQIFGYDVAAPNVTPVSATAGATTGGSGQ